MEQVSFIIWSVGTALYALFIAWYHNWRGALTPSEIDAYVQKLNSNAHLDKDKKHLIIRFMREDTACEFLMLNLLKFPDNKIAHPTSGELVSGLQLLQSYFRPFIGQIFRRAGHLAYNGRIKADYIEDWRVAPNPGWQMMGLVRYRSRRDFLEAVLNPDFADVHEYKLQALAATMALPVEALASFMLSPRLWVPLLLVALCALAHLGYLVA